MFGWTERLGRPPSFEQTETELNVAVVFTSVKGTFSALRKAAALVNRLNARITLSVAQVVPYPLSLDHPPVPSDWNERRLQEIASANGASHVNLYLCRDPFETLQVVLKPHSLIVIGGRKRRGLATREQRLAGRFQRAGHEVIFIETE